MVHHPSSCYCPRLGPASRGHLPPGVKVTFAYFILVKFLMMILQPEVRSQTPHGRLPSLHLLKYFTGRRLQLTVVHLSRLCFNSLWTQVGESIKYCHSTHLIVSRGIIGRGKAHKDGTLVQTLGSLFLLIIN